MHGCPLCAKSEETAALPWYALPGGLLHLHEVGEDTEFCGSAGDHDDEPEVELRFGPVVFAPAFRDADDFGRHVEGWWRWKGEEGEGGGRASMIGRPYMSLRWTERCQEPAGWALEGTLAMPWAFDASRRERGFRRCPISALQLYPGLCFGVHQAQTTLS